MTLKDDNRGIFDEFETKIVLEDKVNDDLNTIANCLQDLRIIMITITGGAGAFAITMMLKLFVCSSKRGRTVNKV